METTLTISDSIETGSTVETELVRVVSLSTREITEITRLKRKKKKNDLQGPNTLILRQTINIKLIHNDMIVPADKYVQNDLKIMMSVIEEKTLWKKEENDVE